MGKGYIKEVRTNPKTGMPYTFLVPKTERESDVVIDPAPFVAVAQSQIKQGVVCTLVKETKV